MSKITLSLLIALFCCCQKVQPQPRETNGQPKQQKTANTPSPVISQSPVNDAAEAAREAYRKERDTKEDVFRSDQARQNEVIATASYRMFWLTAINVFIAAVYALFAFLTLRAIEKQAESAGEQLDGIKGQARIMRGTWATIRRQATLMEKSITHAQESAIYAQRAYLVAKIRNDDPYHFKLAIENGGNTPANNVKVSYSCRVMQDPPWRLDEQTKQIVHDIGSDIEKGLGVIAPNGSHGTVETVAFTPRTDIEKQEWERGVKLFCWGRIHYEDIFQKDRHTDFCFYKSHQQPQGDPCEYGNEAT